MQYEGDLIRLEAVSGKMRDKYNRRSNSVYGLDTEYAPLSGVSIGGSMVRQKNSELQMESLYAARLNVTRNWWNIYLEAARPAWIDAFSYYLAFSGAFSNFAVTLEWKDYNKLAFRNNLNADYNAAPSLTREHAYTLLNRHPHALNLNDEKGYQLETSWFPNEDWQVLFNSSYTYTHSGLRIFEEYYGEISHIWSERLDGLVAMGWNYDRTTQTENIIPILDLYYNFTRRNQLHINFQHQHTRNALNKSEYDDEMLIVELTQSPYLSLALVGEYTNQNQLRNITMDRNTWLYGNITFSFRGNQQLSLLYGSRQAGFICVGGICRYEPEFEGLEIKLLNRF
jgi:hypothetical protein